jgi:hypothetical protein
MWTGLNWLRIRSSGMLFEYSNETSRSTECQSSFQGGSYSLELTIQEKLPWIYLFFIAGAYCRTPVLLSILRTGVSVVRDTHRTPSHCLFIAGTCCKTPVQLCILMTGCFCRTGRAFSQDCCRVSCLHGCEQLSLRREHISSVFENM